MISPFDRVTGHAETDWFEHGVAIIHPDLGRPIPNWRDRGMGLTKADIEAEKTGAKEGDAS